MGTTSFATSFAASSSVATTLATASFPGVTTTLSLHLSQLQLQQALHQHKSQPPHQFKLSRFLQLKPHPHLQSQLPLKFIPEE